MSTLSAKLTATIASTRKQFLLRERAVLNYEKRIFMVINGFRCSKQMTRDAYESQASSESFFEMTKSVFTFSEIVSLERFLFSLSLSLYPAARI